jgi:hypothetical protein
MNISDEHVAAVEALGYTRDEARFLYIVATFSGYFVPRQFITFVHAKWGKRSDHFLGKLESRGHATWREYPGVGGTYHLFSKTLYRVIDKENLRNRRRHSAEFIRTRLVLLDFVLTNQDRKYLETENDRVSYFCQILGVPRALLPVKAYPGPSRLDPALRYFVDKFPIFVEESPDSSGSAVTLCYVDAGETTIAGFAHYLKRYKRLLANLADFRFLYVSNSTLHFAAAERAFAAFARRALQDDPSGDLLRYFTLRARWDEKQYGTFSNDDIESLNEANGRFCGQHTERLYAAWTSGELTDDTLAAQFGGTRRVPKFRFRTWLVSVGDRTAKELEMTG